MTLKTLDNALDVLSYFTEETPTWGLRSLAREMNINHTILNRILKTFEAHGYLRQNDETKMYELGLKFMEFTSIIRKRMKLSEFVKPVMKELVELVDEAVYLTLRDGNDGVTIEIEESLHPIQYTVSVGSRTPLHVGASCKAIAAYLSREEQEKIFYKDLRTFTEYTMTEVETLQEDLRIVKEQGWSHTQGEYVESVTGVSVPLFNHKNIVFGSLTVAGPTYRMQREISFYVTELQKKARMIEEYFEKFNHFYV